MSVYAPPPAPSSIKEAGVGHKLLFDLLLKLMHVEGLSTVTMLAARSRLPAPLLADLVEEAREFALLESRGTRGDFSAELRYALTGKGHDWAIEALERCQYVGPAPVSLEAFREQVRSSGSRASGSARTGSCAVLRTSFFRRTCWRVWGRR
jgi:hypothetical protein